MNKHSVITAIAIIVIITPIAYSGWNIFAVQQLEYRWDNPGIFAFFTLSNHGEMEFCNTMPFWTDVQKFEISAFYDEEHLGSFVINPFTASPYSSTIQKGNFVSPDLLTAQHIFMTMDFQFDGGDIRLDPSKMTVLVEIDTPIMGIIPYSATNQMSGLELDKIMNSEELYCN